MSKTVQKIQGEFSEEASALLNDWYTRFDAARNGHTPVPEPRGVTLTPAQRQQAEAAAKAESAAKQAQQLREQYIQDAQYASEQIQVRRNRLEKQVFGAPNVDTATLLRVATASEKELVDMVETARDLGALDAAKPALAAAHRKGYESVKARFFEAAPELAEAYEEWASAPDDETMQRRLADADKLFPTPTADDFMPAMGVA